VCSNFAQPAAPAGLSVAELHGVLGRVLGVVFLNSRIPWAAFCVNRFGLTGDQDVELYQDSMLLQMSALGAATGIEHFQTLFPAELARALAANVRPELLQRSSEAANIFNQKKCSSHCEMPLFSGIDLMYPKLRLN
jgi:hypothetical protein